MTQIEKILPYELDAVDYTTLLHTFIQAIAVAMELDASELEGRTS